MFEPSSFPAELLAGPFTTIRAQECDVSYGRLRHKNVVRLSRGIRTVDDADVPLALLTRPYTQVAGYSAASHATAFAIWEFPGFLPDPAPDLIHVSRQWPHNLPRRPGVVGHRTQFRPDEVLNLDGLWITSRVRTWLDCSRRMSVDELVVVADHLVRIPRPEFEGRDMPYATIEDLATMLDRHKGTPGIQKARQALALARVGSDSAPETRLRLAVGYAGLPEPAINEEVPLAPGTTRTPDQAYPEYRVGVEYEGSAHSDPEQVLKDIRREEDFTNNGWIQVRIAKDHMANEAKAAVRKIRTALYSRGWRPASK